MKNFLRLTIIGMMFCVSAFSQKPAKITTDELVTKHLASIASPEVLSAVKSRVMVGDVNFKPQLGASTPLNGPAQLASKENKIVFAMIFNSTVYPSEKVGYNGQKLSLGVLPTIGRRSALGDYFKTHDFIFKQGLFGGALSSAWSLLDLNARKAKLEYGGVKEINGQKVYKFKYNSSGSGDLLTSLYFEVETFRHVRSEYEYVFTSRMGTSSVENARQRQRRFILTEEFSDFRREDKLVLPHKYELKLVIDEEKGTQNVEWKIDFSQFVFNEDLDDKAFEVS